MAIDKSLRQEYADQDNGLNKVLRYVSADKDEGYWRDKKNLPINVIPFPFKKSFKEELEQMEEEKKRLEKEKETRGKPIKRYASYTPEIDDAIMAMEYWTQRFESHPLRHKFRNLKEFISWSMSNEDQPFNKGGLASLII